MIKHIRTLTSSRNRLFVFEICIENIKVMYLYINIYCAMIKEVDVKLSKHLFAFLEDRS